MKIKRTINSSQVLEWKKRRDKIKAANQVGFIPIGNRPKPIYIIEEATTEGFNMEAFDRYCDKVESNV